MLDVAGWVYGATVAALVAIIAVDVVVSTRRPHEPSMRESVAFVVSYAALAAAFGVGLGFIAGWRWTGEFAAGWVTEYSLSVDNLFVFALILSSFAVPRAQQQKVLLWGIVGALILRAGFIAAGAAALERFTATFYVFGVVLFVTAIQLIRGKDHAPDMERNPVWRLANRVIPGNHPLVPVMLAIGLTDIVFALDSIPAIYGLTREPYLVFTANAFALLGLRQAYFLLSRLLDRLTYLRHGLAVILAFIGVKLVLEAAHAQLPQLPHIPTSVSLAVIIGVLATATIASLRRGGDTREVSGEPTHPRESAPASAPRNP